MLRDSKYKISISISWKVGLDKLSMLLRKKSFGTRINHRLYCSQGTKMFILKMFPLTPDKCLASLTPHEPHMVHVYDGQEMYTLRVTGIPSNYCQGSLMFMFEKLDMDRNVVRRILYTGDFRYDDSRTCLGSIPCLKSLHHNSSPLTINELYLDTTFCSMAFPSFPTRNNAEEKIWQVCQRWVRRNGMFKDTNPHHVVILDIPPRAVGYESIVQKIHHKSLNKWLVHTSEETLSNSVLTGFSSADPCKAPWIHSCQMSSYKNLSHRSLPCQGGQFEASNILKSVFLSMHE